MDTVELIWMLAVTILALLNIVWQFDLQTRQRRLQERYERLASLEGSDVPAAGLGPVLARLEGVQGKIDQVETLARQLQTTLGHAIQGVGIVRFRAFADTGGDQSFALALVDGGGNGVVISALYGRDETRVYGKPLGSWTSPYNLSDEEKQALEQARRMVG